METIILILLLIIMAQVSLLILKQPRRQRLDAKHRSVFVDTSALIDGRIIALAETGFVSDALLVPRSVIAELQLLADGSDHDKRERARFGLDVVKQLQDMTDVSVTIFQDGSKATTGVDDHLLSLAKNYNALICTIDYNLNKVATVEGIQVLNINELARQLRMAYLPGERASLELVQKGQDKHQAVGYLKDGTMVVVENSDKEIGKTVTVEFIRSLQTAAGKMMFATLVVPSADKKKKPARATQKKPLLKKVVRSNNSKKMSTKKPTDHDTKATDKKQPQTTPSDSAPKSLRKSKSSRKRRTHEDDLLDLVDAQ